MFVCFLTQQHIGFFLHFAYNAYSLFCSFVNQGGQNKQQFFEIFVIITTTTQIQYNMRPIISKGTCIKRHLYEIDNLTFPLAFHTSNFPISNWYVVTIWCTLYSRLWYCQNVIVLFLYIFIIFCLYNGNRL